MPGQCYGCGAQFGVFKKEHGCKNCGFSFCSKCLKDKTVPVPKRNNTKHTVCHKCFKILTGELQESTDKKQYDLPEAYLKRVAAHKEKESSATAAVTSTKVQRMPEHIQSLDPPDRDIAMRLEKLKEDRQSKVQVSDADLNLRLAKLKGHSHDPAKRPIYQAPDSRSQVEQVDNLLEQISSEVAIDTLRPDPAQEVEARLAQLKSSGQENKMKSDVVDDNNTNQLSKNGDNVCGMAGNNDLSKVDKVGNLVQPFDKNIGNSPKVSGSTNMTRPGDDVYEARGPTAEEIQHLMEQASKDLDLDARRQLAGLNQDKEIAARLRQIQANQIRQSTAETVDAESDSEEENEDAAAGRIIQRYLAEANIDDKVGIGGDELNDAATERKKNTGKTLKQAKSNVSDSPVPSNIKTTREDDCASASESSYDDSDELPYCCMCTEDAVIRCRDCDLDLFCNACFRSCHQELDIVDHRTTPYRAPKGYK